jgi:DNA-binding MarR family transcriptional regulator
MKGSSPAAPFRPVGYWLKHLDRLIEENLDRALAGAGLTRRHWQALSTIARSPASEAELAAALEPFVRGDPSAQAAVIDDLTGRGWITRAGDGRLGLTPAGLTAHRTAAERVQESRDLVRRGVSADEYAAVTDVLARMAANLETR